MTESTKEQHDETRRPAFQISKPIHEAEAASEEEGDGIIREPCEDFVGDDKNVTIRCGHRHSLRLNHNVFLSFILTLIFGVSYSMWAESVLTVYFKLLFEQNLFVGIARSAHGFAEWAFAFSLGYLVKTGGRLPIIQYGGLLFCLTAVMHAATTYWTVSLLEEGISASEKLVALVLLIVVMALWGICSVIVAGPVDALFADSIPAGNGSRFYKYLFMVKQSASTMGPLLSIVLFQSTGNDWDFFTLQAIIFIGLILQCMIAVVMIMFDDTKALKKGGSCNVPKSENDSKLEHGQIHETNFDDGIIQPQQKKSNKDRPDSSPENAILHSKLLVEKEKAKETIFKTPDLAQLLSAVAPAEEGAIAFRRWIPHIVFVSDFVQATGFGMMNAFIALYLKEDAAFSPSQVQVLFVFVPGCMAAFSHLATKMARSSGRAQIFLIYRLISISLFYIFVSFSNFLIGHGWLLSIIFVGMWSMAASTRPLSESIVIDFIPTNERARWSSLEVVSRVGWAGSAIFGGVVSDAWGYVTLFWIAALLESIAAILFAFLLVLVPKTEGGLRDCDNVTDPELVITFTSTHGRDTATDNNVGTSEHVYWETLPENVKEGALVLGFDQATWDDDKESEVCKLSWDSLSPRQKKAAIVLGYTEETWDGKDE
ncbi:hypothetical protein ACA910_002039 [Epithemia clementina (nom. ined.)]